MDWPSPEFWQTIGSLAAIPAAFFAYRGWSLQRSIADPYPTATCELSAVAGEPDWVRLFIGITNHSTTDWVCSAAVIRKPKRLLIAEEHTMNPAPGPTISTPPTRVPFDLSRASSKISLDKPVPRQGLSRLWLVAYSSRSNRSRKIRISLRMRSIESKERYTTIDIVRTLPDRTANVTD
jgi:hypothetical protein